MTTEKLVAAKVEALWEMREWAHKQTVMHNGDGVADKVWDEIKARHALLPAHTAHPELRWPGVEVVKANQLWWDVRTSTHFLDENYKWSERSETKDRFGCFGNREVAMARLSDPRTPPPPHVAEKPAEVWPRWFAFDSDHRNGTHGVWRMTSHTEGAYWVNGEVEMPTTHAIRELESTAGIIELTEATCPALAEARREWRERQGKASDAPTWSTGAPPKPGDTLVVTLADSIAGDDEMLKRAMKIADSDSNDPANDGWFADAKRMTAFARSEVARATAAITAERDRLADRVDEVEAERDRLKDNRSARAAKKPGRAKRKGARRGK